jgi:hypothetical protein
VDQQPCAVPDARPGGLERKLGGEAHVSTAVRGRKPGNSRFTGFCTRVVLHSAPRGAYSASWLYIHTCSWGRLLPFTPYFQLERALVVAFPMTGIGRPNLNASCTRRTRQLALLISHFQRAVLLSLSGPNRATPCTSHMATEPNRRVRWPLTVSPGTSGDFDAQNSSRCDS